MCEINLSSQLFCIPEPTVDLSSWHMPDAVRFFLSYDSFYRYQLKIVPQIKNPKL